MLYKLERRCILAVAAALLLVAGPAMGQQQEELPRGTIEGGYSSFSAGTSAEGVSVSISIDGFYVGGSGRVHERLDIYGAWNRFSVGGDSGNITQIGTQFRLGPVRWIARPSLRGGIMASEGDIRTGAGFAMHFGRRAGGLISADFTSIDGVVVSIFRVGGYVGFGGGN